MEQPVDVPGRGIVYFPENMSRGDIEQAIQRDMASQGKSAPKEPAQQKPQIDLVSSGIIRGAANTVGAPGDIMTLLGAAGGKVAELAGKPDLAQYFKPELGYGSKMLTNALERITGTQLYQPQGNAEKRASAAIEGFASGVPMGKAVGLFNAAGNTAGEVAAENFPNTPWARPAASILTQLGLSAPSMARSSPGVLLNDATKGVTEAQYLAAQKLIQEASVRGIRLTPAEALGQVQGTANTPLLNMQRVIEQSRGGGPAMSQAMAERPGQIRAAADAELNKLGPAARDPYSIPPRVQNAATDTIVEAEKLRTAAVTPAFNRANQIGKIDRADTMRVISDIDAQIAKDTTGLLAKNLGPVKDLLTAQKATATTPPVRTEIRPGIYTHTPAVPGKPFEPAVDIENLNRARKILRERIDLPAFSADAIPKEIGARIGRSLDELEGKMLANSADYRAGMNRYIAMSEKFVDPLKRQPIGQLATAETADAQRNILFKVSPESGSENVIRSAVIHMNAKDPTVARDMARQYLATRFDEVSQGLQGGANQWGGAKFAATITGNDQQAKNLRTVIETMNPNSGQAIWKGFDNFLEVLRATGKRQQPGSMTAFNAEINREMGNSGLALGATKLAFAPGTVLTKADSIITRWQQGANGEALANIFLDKDAINKIRQLSMTTPDSPRAKMLVASILAGQQNVMKGSVMENAQ